MKNHFKAITSRLKRKPKPPEQPAEPPMPQPLKLVTLVQPDPEPGGDVSVGKTEAVISPQSDDQPEPVTTTPAIAEQGIRVPSTKRQRKFERQVQRAKAGIVSGTIQPKTREVSDHCQCAYRTALSILATLTTDGVLVRDGRLWKIKSG